MESWKDFELLKKGQFVPVFKTEKSWKTWISYDGEAVKKEVSLGYKDYLRVFLLMVPREVKLARILDVIQLNESRQNSWFQILDAVTSFSVNAICIYDRKKDWSFKVEGTYSYAKIA